MLELKQSVIYGPVRSRRLGRSLGINLLPAGQKACTFDCLYCQYGLHSPVHESCREFPSVSHVLSSLESALTEMIEPPEYLTFSGNGEPTLHPDFSAIVNGVLKIRDRLAPKSATAILSNSSRLNIEGIRHAVSLLDKKILKLDAVTESVFIHYNRPVHGVTLKSVVDALEQIKNVTIQSLITHGRDGNFHEADVSTWIQTLKQISPESVQIYSLARESPCKSIYKMDVQALDRISSQFNDAGLKTIPFTGR